MDTRPARVALATTSASRVAGALDLSTTDPAVVTRPSISKRSFHAIGIPSHALSGLPSRRRCLEAWASFSARSSSNSVKIAGSEARMFSNVSSISSTGQRLPFSRRAAISTAETESLVILLTIHSMLLIFLRLYY